MFYIVILAFFLVGALSANEPDIVAEPESAQAVNPDLTVVGGGPGGLWAAIQAKKRDPELNVTVYERFPVGQKPRKHVLRIDRHSLDTYSCKTNDQHEKDFYEKIFIKKDASYLKSSLESIISPVSYIKTNDIEAALRDYAQKLGVVICYEKIESAAVLQERHPACKLFIAADGARSKMREQVFGKEAVNTKEDLQYVIEFKYEAQLVKGHASTLFERYKISKLLNFLAFEYVGRKDADQKAAITLRFFVDKQTYESMPVINAENPLLLEDSTKAIPELLKNDINTYLNIRQDLCHETYQQESGKLTTLALSLYSSERYVQQTQDGKAWFLVGDAAMGIPYFRSLNCAFLCGSRLAGLIAPIAIQAKEELENNQDPLRFAARPKRSGSSLRVASKMGSLSAASHFESEQPETLKAALIAYNAFAKRQADREFSAAFSKDFGLKMYNFYRKVSRNVPWEWIKFGTQERDQFNRPHQAVKLQALVPGINPNQSPRALGKEKLDEESEDEEHDVIADAVVGTIDAGVRGMQNLRHVADEKCTIS